MDTDTTGNSGPGHRSRLIRYVTKMKGARRTTPLLPPASLDVLISWLGAFLGIGTVTLLSMVCKMPLLVASFGASAVLVYGVPDVPLAQPRNVIGGHFLSAVTAVIVYAVFGSTWWSISLAVALAIALMLVTHTAHPPGGATALVGVLTKASPSFIFTPVASGAIILVAVGLLTNNLSPNRHYPRYWI
ncbi:MAG TPA: HPP family protein [Spirochaetia bacterium]|nr:HPP family protein [Spirochaetia bacterium]